jgi:hypothetical protein
MQYNAVHALATLAGSNSDAAAIFDSEEVLAGLLRVVACGSAPDEAVNNAAYTLGLAAKTPRRLVPCDPVPPLISACLFPCPTY